MNYDKKQIQALKGAARELHELSLGVERAIKQAAETGDLRPSKEKYAELELKTAEFSELRASLHPAVVFLAIYSVEVLCESPPQVSLTIPARRSRIDLINDAERLVEELYGRPGVYKDALASWRADPEFTEPVRVPTNLRVEGCVPDSTDKTRAEQEEKGWNDVDLRDLAVAHQASLVATGQDFFEGKVVRACGGALYFASSGLGVGICDDGCRAGVVSGSRSLRVPNKKLDRWNLNFDPLLEEGLDSLAMQDRFREILREG